MKKELKTELLKLSFVFFFCIWMAYLESAVVVYLREIYYPGGFHFPIVFIPNRMAFIEIGREAATIFMLLSIAFLAGKTRWTRLAYFMFSFGAWDIWYYGWLKIFLNWPESLLTWDLLFLIPVPWAGPVLAPVLVSISLMTTAIVILNVENKGIAFQLKKWELTGIVIAPVLIFISFITEAPMILKPAIPSCYHWELLIFGEAIGIVILASSVKRLLKKQ